MKLFIDKFGYIKMVYNDTLFQSLFDQAKNTPFDLVSVKR